MELRKLNQKLFRCLLPISIVILSMMLMQSFLSQRYVSLQELAPNNGVLDIRDIDFSDNVYNLVNSWDFYPEKLYTSEDFKNGTVEEKADSGVSADNYGYGTYHLKILAEPNQYYTLCSFSMDYATLVYVNGAEVVSYGKIADNAEDFVPQGGYMTVPMASDENGEIDIIYQYGNYVHNEGGFIQTTYISTPQNMEEFKAANDLTSLTISGGLVMLMLYFFMSAAVLRKGNFLCLAFCCLLMALRNQNFYSCHLLPPDTSWYIVYRLFIIIVMLMPVSLLLLLKFLYYDATRNWPLYIYLGIAAVAVILISVIPTQNLFLISTSVYYLSIPYLLYLIYGVTRHYIKLRRLKMADILVLAGFFILLVSMLYEALLTNQRAAVAHYGAAAYGMISFVFLNASAINLQIQEKELSLLAKMPENILDSILQKNPDIQIDKISSDCLSFETYSSDETRIYEIFDTKLKKFIEKQTVVIEGDKITETIENTQNNIKQKIVSDRYNSVIEDEQIFRYDKNGELLSVEHLRKNDGIVGQNASLTDKNGKIYPLQRENFDNETGIKSVEKNFTSPDGTRTEYFYEEMPDGSRISEYKIIDSSGNVLLNEHTTFASVNGSKNRFVSSRNGIIYEIEHRNDKIIITDKTENKTAEIDINKLTGSKPENFVRVLKQLSGDYLMRIAENPIKLEEAEFDPGLWGNESKVLYLGVSEWFSGDEEKFSVFLHELGHYIDTEKIGDDFGIYSGNRELNEIFKKEIENFKKHSTIKQQTFIDYFIGDRGKSSAAETFAESNMLLSTPYSTRRAYYLQQNFPRTIAKIAELIKSDLQ